MKYIILLFLAVTVTISQTIEVERVITDNYPDVTAEFRVKDANGDEVRNLTPDNFLLKDAGIDRTVDNVFCQANVTRFSVVLTFDASGSMNENISESGSYDPPSRISVVRSVARNFVDQLPGNGRTESALNIFSGNAEIIQEFTEDKDVMKGAINGFNLQIVTNYNTGFLGKNGNGQGALDLVERARYKPVIIFLTDGAHDYNFGAIQTQEIISRAQQTGTIIYCLSIGPEANNSGSEMSTIANSTGGRYYDQLVSEQQIQDIYTEILQAAQGFGDPAPCELTYQTDCDGGELELSYTGFGDTVSTTFSYTIPDEVKPNLNITDREFLDVNSPLNQAKKIAVSLTAENNDLVISGYNSNTPEFEILNGDWGGTDPPFMIAQGETRNISVTYTPTQRQFYGGQIDFNGTACSGLTMNPKGGFRFAELIDFGQVDQGDSKNEIFTERFCNYTDEDVEIFNILITGGPNQADFSVNYPGGIVVPAGQCYDIDASFEPRGEGARSAEYTVRTDKGDFTSTMQGGGTGNPVISASANDFNDVNCVNNFDTVSVNIENTGPVDLNVTNVTIDNTTDFTILGSTNFTVAPGMTESNELQIQFNPQTDGVKTVNVTIESNAENGTQTFELTGERVAIDYNPDDVDVVFSQFCANESNPAELTINVINNNDFSYSVSASSDSPEFSTDNNSYLLPASGSQEVIIRFGSDVNGTYSGTITLESECGDIVREITVSGIINTPEVSDLNYSIVSVIGSNGNQTQDINNPNAEPVNVVNAFVGDAAQNPINEFTLSATNFVVPGNGTYPLTITYTPDANDPIELSGILYLIVEEPCDVTLDNILVEGSPDLAVSTLSIPADNIDLIGNITSIPVTLTAGEGFEQSGTTTIIADLEFDSDVLDPQSGTFVSNNGNLETYRYEFDITTQLSTGESETFNIDFEVLNSLPKDNTILDLVAGEGVNDNGESSSSVGLDDGVFTIAIPDADIEMENASAAPGETFVLPIRFNDDDEDLDENLHRDITVKLIYNYTVLEAVDANYNVIPGTDLAELDVQDELKFNSGLKGKIQGLNSIIDFTNINFRAKLGNTQVSDILIEQVTINSNGYAEINLDTVQFTLNDVCETEDGSVRLFQPGNNEAGLRIDPNPVTTNSTVLFSNIEIGYHNISVYDLNGNKVNELVNESYSGSGLHEAHLNTTELSNGNYYIIYETPTQRFTVPLIINK